MVVLEKDNTYCFDVDLTLIEPYSYKVHGIRNDVIKIDYYGISKPYLPIFSNMQLLNASIMRGRHTVVWSGNGYQHCVNVLKALKLDHLDITVMSKPIGYCDDKDIETWAGPRSFVK